MKKIIAVILCLVCVNGVNALDTDIYTNSNGVNMTIDESNFINELYYDGYANIITYNEYSYLKENNLFNQEITKHSSFVIDKLETSAKILDASKVCSNICYIVTTLKWKKEPKVKSYDVIGTRFENTSLVSNVNTSIIVNNKNVSVGENKMLDNGFGTSFLLPNESTVNTKVIQSFAVSKKGSVYISYQHAKTKTTLSKSMDYKIGKLGLGGVFEFNHTNIYDGMSGIKISL